MSIEEPTVLISGGGPAGLLTALLLAQHSIPSTIIEKSAEADEWNSRSYSISMKDNGRLALQNVPGVWEAITEAAMLRTGVHITLNNEGKQMKLPVVPAQYSIARPLLIQCLESFASDSERITIQRGVTVVGLSPTTTTTSATVDEYDTDEQPPQVVQVKLSDGTTKSVTHVIGADGKWSAVRQSISVLADSFRVTTEPSWGLSLTLPKVPTGWDVNAYHVFKPTTDKLPMYVLGSILSTGKVSVSIVCYTQVLDRYPFVAPPADDTNGTMKDWSLEYTYSTSPDTTNTVDGDDERDSKIHAMLHYEFPAFHQVLAEMGELDPIKINRNVSWLENIAAGATEEDGGETKNDGVVTYSAMNGRVALIGDAAHGMTPSTGNGCNCALESAAELVGAIKEIPTSDGQIEQPVISVQSLSNAFAYYGTKRPPEVIPKQLEAALVSRKMPTALSSRKPKT